MNNLVANIMVNCKVELMMILLFSFYWLIYFQTILPLQHYKYYHLLKYLWERQEQEISFWRKMCFSLSNICFNTHEPVNLCSESSCESWNNQDIRSPSHLGIINIMISIELWVLCIQPYLTRLGDQKYELYELYLVELPNPGPLGNILPVMKKMNTLFCI